MPNQGNNTETEQRYAALHTNASAIKAVAGAVEGTLGPKGMDTMLVDKKGEVVVTNDGATILDLMEAGHPAARMLVNVARNQQREIGDGTTTATIMAGSLISAGADLVTKGVPVAKIIEGMRAGVDEAINFFYERARKVTIDDGLLFQTALVAGRENADVAKLTIEAARFTAEKLGQKHFCLADLVVAQVGADNQVFQGLIINKERMSPHMPPAVNNATVLIIDDALEPEEIKYANDSNEAFLRQDRYREEFLQNIEKVIEMGVKIILTDRGVIPMAEQRLADAGIMVLQRVAHKELARAAEHTGARMIKRTGLNKPVAELQGCLGFAAAVREDEQLKQTYIVGGQGKPTATILVGASTEEVVGERERIARDAASAVQAALKAGIVPGGGAIELAAMVRVQQLRREMRGMAAYGIDCVLEALKKPFSQIVANAGFNPLEKLGDVLAAQAARDTDSLALDCDRGEVADMWQSGVVDPVLVKVHALKAAAEVAEAILRIDTIIRKKEINSRDRDAFNQLNI